MSTGPIRIAFLGTPDIAATCLEALAADDRFDIAAVVTNPDRPAGRGRSTSPPPVKQSAEGLGKSVLQPARAAEAAEQLSSLDLDVAAVVAYGSLLPDDVLATTAHGFVNLHYSLLPRWRGAAPVQHAIRQGDQTTGVTAFLLDAGMDTGPIIRQSATDIGPRESAGELLARLTTIGAPLLSDALAALVAGEQPTPQPEEGVALAPRIHPDDVEIDWYASHGAVDRLCRSADPRPGAHTTFRERRLKVFGARPVNQSGSPGTIVELDEQGPVVACGTGAVRLDDVQPDGRARMTGRDLVNGHRLEVGEQLGTG